VEGGAKFSEGSLSFGFYRNSFFEESYEFVFLLRQNEDKVAFFVFLNLTSHGVICTSRGVSFFIVGRSSATVSSSPAS
jgi:hypothetical protein